MTNKAGTFWGTFSSADNNAIAMKLMGSSPMAAVRRIAAVPLNSLDFLSIQVPTPASDQVKRARSAGMIV